MILDNEKKEEYREIKKHYIRMLEKNVGNIITVKFRNGYTLESPYVICICNVSKGYGKKEWGAEENKEYYVLKIIKMVEDNMVRTRVVNLKQEPYDVYIGRENPYYGLTASIWQNPFKIGKDGNRKQVIEKYKEYLLNSPDLMIQLPELKGKKLGCYCKPLSCHGDILVELVNDLDQTTLP
jgi:hypothetical protein